MPILRAYHTDDEGSQSFREAWYDEETRQFVVNRGPVGHLSETPVVEDELDPEEGERLLQAFAAQCEEDGYAELTLEEQSWVHVRLPLKGAEPSAREKTLASTLSEALTGHLAWRGLGTVEGTVFGPGRMSILVLTPAPKTALKAIVSCVREAARSDLSKLVLAVAPGTDASAAKVRHPLPARGEFVADPLPQQD